MDPTEIANWLATVSPDEIDAAADELHAYARHRRAETRDVAMAPFNAGNFFKNLGKVVVALWPFIAPLVGLDPKTLPPVPAPTTPPSNA